VTTPSISPLPSDEEAAVITAAMIEMWPRMQVVLPEETPVPSIWRFSGRWWSKPVPARRARPWM
jgi:hypothetical protein